MLGGLAWVGLGWAGVFCAWLGYVDLAGLAELLTGSLCCATLGSAGIVLSWLCSAGLGSAELAVMGWNWLGWAAMGWVRPDGSWPC